MDNFIHPLSVIPYSTSAPTPTTQEVIGLTSDSIWSWLVHCLGWHEPALSEPVKRMIRKRFESVPFNLRRLFIRPDLIPHRYYPPDSFTLDSQPIVAFYRLTAAIRRLAVRDIHRLFRDPSRNRVDRYDKAHQLWLPSAELDWLRMRQGMRKAAEGKLIDFPIAIRFAVQRPQYDRIPNEQPGGQNRTMTLHQRAGDGFWPIEFYSGSRIDHDIGRASISFNRKQSALGIELPTSLGRIGYSWIENATWGPKNRVLFKKVCSDEQIGILLWPSFPDHPHPTPRIPVYYGDIVELVHGDQLMIFVGPKRGLQDVSVQVSVSAQWASSQDPERIYADVKYVYPNPCERYPYCVRRPIYQPVIALDPIDLEEAIRPKSEYNERQADVDQVPSTPGSTQNSQPRQSENRLEREVENEISSSLGSRVDSVLDGLSTKGENENGDHLLVVEITVEVLDEPLESTEGLDTQDKLSDSRVDRDELPREAICLRESSLLNSEKSPDLHATSSVSNKRKGSDLSESLSGDRSSRYSKRPRKSSHTHSNTNLDRSRSRSQTSDVSHTESIRRTQTT